MALLTLPPFRRTPFYFMRHGETDWNLKDIYMGSTDISLNATGQQQAKDVLTLLRSLPIMTVCHSPLKRAHETALIINEILQKPLYCIDDLRECNWGVMEGQSKISTEWRLHWKQGGVIDEAETYQGFIERTNAAIRKALVFPGPVLIVSHGGVYWSILETLKPYQPFPKRLDNCDIVEAIPPHQMGEPWRLHRLTAGEEENDAW